MNVTETLVKARFWNALSLQSLQPCLKDELVINAQARSSTFASGAFFFTDSIPFSIAEVDE